MSVSSVRYSIASSLFRAEEFLGEGTRWSSADTEQDAFINRHTGAAFRNDVARLERDGAVASVCACGEDSVNAFLAERKSDLRIAPIGADEIGTASILDLAIQWAQEGERTRIVHADGGRFPGVRLESSVIHFATDGFDGAVVTCVRSASCDMVHMVMPPERPTSASEVDALVTAARDGIERAGFSADPTRKGVEFPMVDLDCEGDVARLIGMRAHSAATAVPQRLSRAVQQSRLRMNEHGARSRPPGATRWTLGADVPPPLVIDRPFLLWVSRPGPAHPVAAFFITEEAWKDPGNLGE